MVAERRITRMLIIIPVCALLFALLLSLVGADTDAPSVEQPRTPRPFISAATSVNCFFHAAAIGAAVPLAGDR